jgi:hypothetical protein
MMAHRVIVHTVLNLNTLQTYAMKTFCIVLVTYIIMNTMAATSQDMDQTKSLLGQIENKMKQRGLGWAEPSVVVESGLNGMAKMPEFVKLEQLAHASWPQMMTNIETVAPSKLSKTILFVSFQSLPIDDYLQFLDQAVGLAENKIIDKQLLNWALLPWDKNVRGVLDYNYEKPVVKDILHRVKSLYPGDPSMTRLCDGVLSGRAKKEDEAYFNEVPADHRPFPAQQSLGTNIATPPHAATKASPTVAHSVPLSQRPITWIAVGALFLIVGGVFVLKKWGRA